MFTVSGNCYIDKTPKLDYCGFDSSVFEPETVRKVAKLKSI